MRTILVVDDELKITRLVRDFLQHAGFAVLTAGDGPGAVATVRSAKPDLVILDLGLPGMDGLDVIKAIRRHSDLPIIILTARSDEPDRVVGLEVGADDYIVKPFSGRELVARVRAVLRRTEGDSPLAEVVRVGSLEVDVPRMEVRSDGRLVELTATEFQILLGMARRPGRIFTRSQLLDAVHGVAVESYERAIDAHIKNIRRKLEPDPRKPTLILTVYGVGYKVADA